MTKKDTNIIYGRHPIMDAVKAGKAIDKVMLQQGIRGDYEKELRFLCRQNDIQLQVVPKERLNRFVNGNHQGVIGFQSLIEYQHIENVLPLVFEKSETPLFLILDSVTDVRNFGAIARSAEIAGVHAIIIPQKGAALINADAIKTSAGALAKIAVCRENSLVNTIEFLQNSGVQVFASSLEAEGLIQNLDFTHPTALVVGSEDLGVHPSVMKAADETFIIPQIGTTDSFNVSVAAGIMLYEVMRQRF
ncbi:MAG: 23S rRNA (guanosine2251-2'-O)-methyltransferase [Cognaticolwellia sp.]|jgi:23S rRNA (guanosine2251-2'-O)-methyltransferase